MLTPSTGGVAKIPLLGLGTWQNWGRDATRTVADAIAIGYRHFDTATSYDNEEAIGLALSRANVPREDLFVTTKLPDENVGHERETLQQSLRLLKLDYVDLWLIHWPPENEARPDVWQRLIEAQEDHLALFIGVSNYTINQIDELIRTCAVAPALNQIQFGPSHYNPSLIAAHRARGVLVGGYSPFRSTDISTPVLRSIARAHGRTVHQVILRWHFAHGIPSIPKSADRTRLMENFGSLQMTMSADEVALIDQICAER